jgi:putative flippase GtrA
MISTETWPQPAIRVVVLAQRFQRFLVVGSAGLLVNQGLLLLFRAVFDLSLNIASPVAILVSLLVTFTLNERWTWHDRGTGRIAHRFFFYCPINTVGLAINFGVLSYLVNNHHWHYLMANLIGAGLAAIWNFSLNHLITWRA